MHSQLTTPNLFGTLPPRHRASAHTHRTLANTQRRSTQHRSGSKCIPEALSAPGVSLPSGVRRGVEIREALEKGFRAT